MKPKQKYFPTTDAWGIDNGYEDAHHQWKATPERTRQAIMKAMAAGERPERPPDGGEVLVLRPGGPTPRVSRAELILEDGTSLRVEGALPPDLPLGYHELRPDSDASPAKLIVSPGRCPLTDGLRSWGWAVQLYAARSRESWGIGDLADLRRLGGWSAGQGAELLLVNPLHAVAPVLPQEPSPYYPTSRLFGNPLYLRIEEVPGFVELAADLRPLAEAGRKLNSSRRIDRDAIFRLKSDALERLWKASRPDGALDRYCQKQGDRLQHFATYCALSEKHGGDWRCWPAEFRNPSERAVQSFADQNAERLRYHQWLQWLLDEQLIRASRQVTIMQDLPVGIDPGGADSWAWQDVLAEEVSVGAPPDVYNTLGQNWGLPPFIPHKLRAAGYEPFIQTIRASLAHAGGLRIDHVLGLFRLFWIPYGFGAAEGTFVRYPADDLLAIMALESHRAGAVIVGEDLGTVEDAVQEKLAAHRILSYRVFWFEDEPPQQYPELALSAVTTHDLPTIAGVWTGSDLETQRKLGLSPNEAGMAQMRQQLQTMAGAADSDPAEEVIERTHRLLATAPSVLVTAALDDALAVEERPNMPGPPNDWPSWCIALPRPLEEIENEDLPKKIAAAFNECRGRSIVVK